MFDRGWNKELAHLLVLARQKPISELVWKSLKLLLESKKLTKNIEEYGLGGLLDVIYYLPSSQKQQSIYFLEKISARNYLHGVEEFVKYMLLLPEDKVIFFYEEYKQNFIRSNKQWALFLDCLPKHSHLTLWEHLLPDTAQLCLTLRSLKVPSSRYVFLHGLDINFLKTKITDGNDLANISSCLPGLYRKDFLEGLDSKFLIATIQDGHQLARVTASLVLPADRVQFLQNLGEAALNTIVKDEAQLVDVVSTLPRSSFAEFLQHLSDKRAASAVEAREASRQLGGLFDSRESREERRQEGLNSRNQSRIRK